LRGQLELIKAANPVPLEEVESASLIVRRFVTGIVLLFEVGRLYSIVYYCSRMVYIRFPVHRA